MVNVILVLNGFIILQANYLTYIFIYFNILAAQVSL
jgi:hypothetical protein